MTDHSSLIERLEAAKRSTMLGGETCFLPVPLVDEVAAALRDLTELLAGFVQDEDDARANPMGGLSLGGLMDCRDNAGCVYQSAGLAARIAKARVLTLPSAPNRAKDGE